MRSDVNISFLTPSRRRKPDSGFSQNRQHEGTRLAKSPCPGGGRPGTSNGSNTIIRSSYHITSSRASDLSQKRPKNPLVNTLSHQNSFSLRHVSASLGAERTWGQSVTKTRLDPIKPQDGRPHQGRRSLPCKAC